MIILIADKSFRIRSRIKKLLTDLYNEPAIYETEASDEAMALVKMFKPDLIITDIDLEKGSGLSLLSAVRTYSPSSIKIVFTNHIKDDIEFISRRLGANHFLSKAHDFIKIKHILRSTTNNYNTN